MPKNLIAFGRHGNALPATEETKELGRPLSTLGRKQAEIMRDILRGRDFKFRHVYSSNARRAMETASIISGKSGDHMHTFGCLFESDSPSDAAMCAEAFSRLKYASLREYRKDETYPALQRMGEAAVRRLGQYLPKIGSDDNVITFIGGHAVLSNEFATHFAGAAFQDLVLDTCLPEAGVLLVDTISGEVEIITCESAAVPA